MSFLKKIVLALSLTSIAMTANATNTMKCPPTTFVSETVAPLLDTIIDHGSAIVFGKKERAIYEPNKQTGWILVGLFQANKNHPSITEAFEHAVNIVSHVDKLDNEEPTAEDHYCIYYSSVDQSAWMYLQPQEFYYIDKNLTPHLRK